MISRTLSQHCHNSFYVATDGSLIEETKQEFMLSHNFSIQYFYLSTNSTLHIRFFMYRVIHYKVTHFFRSRYSDNCGNNENFQKGFEKVFFVFFHCLRNCDMKRWLMIPTKNSLKSQIIVWRKLKIYQAKPQTVY